MAVDNNTFLDSSSNNYALTKTGSVGQGAMSPFFPDWSNSFESSSDYIDASSIAASMIPLAGNKLTIECWILPRNAQGEWVNASIFGNMLNTAYNGRWVLRIWTQSGASADTVLDFNYSTGISTGSGISTTGYAIKAGQWNHIAVTIDATNASAATVVIYVNGVAQTLTASTINLSTHTALQETAFRIGGGFTWGYGAFPGLISNLRVVKNSLVYTGNFTVPTAKLTAIANTVLLTCNSSRFLDTANSYSLVASGTPKVTHISPFVSSYTSATNGGSAYFDGNGNYLLKTNPGNGDFDPGATTAWTLECWVFFTAADTFFVSLGNGGSFGSALTLYYKSDKTIRVNQDNGSTTVVNISTTKTYPTHAWHHVAVSKDSSNVIRLFVNGLMEVSATSSAAVSVNCGIVYNAVYDGGIRLGGSLYLSNVRWVKGSCLYNADFAVPTNPLTAVANTKILSKFVNMGIFDSTGNATILTTGTAKTQATVIKAGSGALQFNGTSDYIKLPSNAAFNQISAKAFTIEFWINPTAWATGAVFNEARTVMTTAYIDTTNGWGIHISPSSQSSIYWLSKVSGTSTYILLPISLNVWTHVAFSYTGSVMTAYLNGKAVASQSISWNNTTDPLIVGALTSGSYGYHYQGYLDSVQISYGAKYTSDFSVADFTPLDKTNYKLTRATTRTLLTGDGNINTYGGTFIDTVANASVTRQGSGVMATAGSFSPFGENWSMFLNYQAGAGIRVPSSNNWNLSSGQGDFTIEFWYKPYYNPTTGSGTFLIGTVNLAYTPGSLGWMLWHDDATRMGIGSNGVSALVSYTWKLGVWQHIAISRSGSNVYVFFDGALYAVLDSATFTNGTNILYIGCDNVYTTRNSNGYISNVRIVKGTAVYNAPFNVPTGRLTAIPNTVLLTCQDNRFVDNSQYKATVSTVAAPIIKHHSPFAVKNDTTSVGSMYFNGSGTYGTTDTIGNFNNKAWTVETWAYCTGYNTGTMCIIQSGQGKNAWVPYVSIGVSSTGIVSTCINGTEYFSANAIPLHTWTHFALERTSGGTVTLYVNGISVVSRTDNIDSLNLSFFVGRRSNAPGGGSYIYDWKGYISNMRIVLNSSVYGTAFVPTNAALTAITGTELLTCNPSKLTDSSGKSHVITITGTPLYSDVSPFFKEIYANSAYMTSGQSLNVSTLPTAIGTGDFTIEGWFYSVNAWSSVLLVTSSTTNSFYFYVQTPSVMGLGQYGQSTLTVTPSPSMVANTWYHIAATRKSGTCAVFINGKRVWTQAYAVSFPAGNVQIGGGLTGYVSNVRYLVGTCLYDPAATNVAVPMTNLTAVSGTQLLLLQDNGIVDGSSNKMTVTANGSVVSTFNPFASGSTYFSGTTYVTAPNSTDYSFGSSDFTVEGWFYPTVGTGATYYTCVCKISGTQSEFYITHTSGQFKYCLTSNVGSWRIAQDSVIGDRQLNAWNHIALCRKGNTIMSYLNGVAGASVPITAALYANTSVLGIGGQGNGIEIFAGYISNVRLVKGLCLYNGPFVPPRMPLQSIVPNETFLAKLDDVSSWDTAGDITWIPLQTTDKPSTTVAAKSGSASQFFAGNGYLSAIYPNFCFDNDFTIEFWAYQTDRTSGTSTYAAPFCVDITSTGAYTQRFYMTMGNASAQCVLAVSNTSLNGWAVLMNWTPASLNAWHHYAITRNGSTWKIWVDGTQAATATYSGIVTRAASTASKFAIGYGSSADSYFKGYIENFKVTEGECLYSTTFTPTY